MILNYVLSISYHVSYIFYFECDQLSASIGFNFAGKTLDFEARFKQVLEFKKSHGHTRSKFSYYLIDSFHLEHIS